MSRIALIGASGLVGSKLAPLLRDQKLLSLARTATLSPYPGWREEIGEKEDWPAMLAGETVDVAIAAIGTTWAKVRDWDAFEAIDRHAVTAFATAAKEAGARQMIVISSTMADPDSRSRYLAIKGAMEADLDALGFDRLDIVRPGLLVGARGEESRPKERAAILLSPLFDRLLHGRFAKFRSVPAQTVAQAIAAIIGQPGRGRFIHHNRGLEIAARRGSWTTER